MKIDLERFVSEYKCYKGFTDIKLLSEICETVFKIIEKPNEIHDFSYEYISQLKPLIESGVSVAIIIEYYPEKIKAIPKKEYKGDMMKNFDCFYFTNDEVFIVSSTLVDFVYVPKENFSFMLIEKNNENFDVISPYNFYSFKTGVNKEGNYVYRFPSLNFINQFFEQYCSLYVVYSANSENLKKELKRAYNSNGMFKTKNKIMGIPGCCSGKKWSGESLDIFVRAINEPNKVDQEKFSRAMENELTSITSLLIPYRICNPRCKESITYAKTRLKLLQDRCPSLLRLIYDNFFILEHSIDLYVLETFVKNYLDRLELKQWYKTMLKMYRDIQINKGNIMSLIQITQNYNERRNEFGDFSLIDNMKKEEKELFFDDDIKKLFKFRYTSQTEECFSRLIHDIHHLLFVSLNIFRPIKLTNT